MRIPSLLWQCAALAGLAAACALVSNALAGPERHLAWGSAPEALPPSPLPAPANGASAPAPAPGIPAPAEPPGAKAAPVPLPAPVPGPKAPAPAAPVRLASPAERFPADPAQPVREIDGAKALELHRMGTPFLDARRTALFREGRVAGAWSAPVWEATLEEALVLFEARVHPGPADPLVIYCDGGGCEDSHLLAQRLFRRGFRNLVIYRDGYPDWVQRGGPRENG